MEPGTGWTARRWQFAFSMYGTLEVGDRITLIYTISGGEDSETYTVIDYVDGGCGLTV